MSKSKVALAAQGTWPGGRGLDTHLLLLAAGENTPAVCKATLTSSYRLLLVAAEGNA